MRPRREPRRTASTTLLGGILGAFFGTLAAFAAAVMAQRRKVGDVEAERFLGTLREVWDELRRMVPWLRRPAKS